MYFEPSTDSLNLLEQIDKYFNSHDKIKQIIVRFPKHPSILKIKQKVKINIKFSFQTVSEDITKNVVKNVPSDKATAEETPVDILKKSQFSFSKFANFINKAFNIVFGQ